MDCRTARLLLDLARPTPAELGTDEAEALDAHLAECPECGALARAERQADARIAVAMRAVVVPTGLRGRILTRLEQDRPNRVRDWLRRPAAAVAAAAAVLLVLAGSWYWLASRPRPLDVDAILELAQETPRRAEDVSTFFANRYGIRTEAPEEFNYNWLASCSLGVVQGKIAPEMLFVRGSLYARVYILTRGQFDLDQARTSSGGYTVEVRPHPRDPRIAYLVVYPGETLEPFLDTAVRPAA